MSCEHRRSLPGPFLVLTWSLHGHPGPYLVLTQSFTGFDLVPNCFFVQPATFVFVEEQLKMPQKSV